MNNNYNRLQHFKETWWHFQLFHQLLFMVPNPKQSMSTAHCHKSETQHSTPRKKRQILTEHTFILPIGLPIYSQLCVTAVLVVYENYHRKEVTSHILVYHIIVLPYLSHQPILMQCEDSVVLFASHMKPVGAKRKRQMKEKHSSTMHNTSWDNTAIIVFCWSWSNLSPQIRFRFFLQIDVHSVNSISLILLIHSFSLSVHLICHWGLRPIPACILQKERKHTVHVNCIIVPKVVIYWMFRFSEDRMIWSEITILRKLL